MMDYPNLAALQASVNATKAKVADLEGQLVQARDENAAREREMITAMLKQAKLPDRLESRSFRAEVNQIAEHWSRYGPSKSGLTFGTLICLCRSLPRTDWDLLQRHPETFREQAPSVNERLGTWKWEVWEWFRKFVNPELQKSCVAAMTFENFKDDLPGLNNQLQCIQRQTNAAETIQLPSATFQNPSGTPVDKVAQNERNESWSRKSPGTTSCNPRECNLADLVPVSRAALLSQPPGYLSSVASYANSESSNIENSESSHHPQKRRRTDGLSGNAHFNKPPSIQLPVPASRASQETLTQPLQPHTSADPQPLNVNGLTGNWHERISGASMDAHNPPPHDSTLFMKIGSVINPSDPQNRTDHRLMNGWAETFGSDNFPYYNHEDNRQSDNPACLSTDLSDFHQKGFSHWNDESTTGAVQSLAASGFWGLPGLNNIYSILANQKLRSFLDQALGPGPYIIRHCSWWSGAASDGQPIYLKRNTERSDLCLGLHILLQGTCIRYFTGSHKESWPAEGLPTFINYDQDRLQIYKQETISNGL
ncbi:hypothetical protein MCOR25_007728 [Pyricularia grisea]|nr:hypothetical protein MCOR25_007728 [Pyricularia grisea]